VAGCCECGDEPSGSCATELVISTVRVEAIIRPEGIRSKIKLMYQRLVIFIKIARMSKFQSLKHDSRRTDKHDSRSFDPLKPLNRPSRHRFPWFSSVFKQMLRWFPNSKLLLHASHAALPILNSSKLPPVVDVADLIVF
jgi:hypothetical protein